MKNKLIFFIFILGCSSPKDEVLQVMESEIKSLRELVNEGLIIDRFYILNDLPEVKEKEEGLVFILPASSCFNCFEELNMYLSTYLSNNLEKHLIVVRNNKVKERENRFSLQKVISLEKIEILEIDKLPFLSQHNFFPKLGYYQNGKICCLEVFEQGDQDKLNDYFTYLRFLK